VPSLSPRNHSPFHFLVQIRAYAKEMEVHEAKVPVLEYRNKEGTKISIDKTEVTVGQLSGVAHTLISKFANKVTELLLGLKPDPKLWANTIKKEDRTNKDLNFTPIHDGREDFLAFLQSNKNLLSK